MISIGHYIRFQTRLAQDLQPLGIRAYQNFFVGQVRLWNEIDHTFAPFAMSGDLSNGSGSAGEAEIVLPQNLLTSSVINESVNSNYLLRVDTVLLLASPPAEPSGIPEWSELQLLTTDYWACNSFTYTDAVPGEEDAGALVTLGLKNPINAVDGLVMTRRLKDSEVGALPASGGITF